MFRPLMYHSTEREHRAYIDRVNANPANCKECGRLLPGDVFKAMNGMCSECFWHFRAKESGFEPTFDYNYEESISRQKRECPEWFQEVL